MKLIRPIIFTDDKNLRKIIPEPEKVRMEVYNEVFRSLSNILEVVRDEMYIPVVFRSCI